MNTKEVRVGNLGIHNGEIAEVTPTSFSNGKVEEMQPIQITEEWLLRFGFDDKEDDMFDLGLIRYIIGGRVLLFLGSDYALGAAMDYDVVELPTEYKYVHQLQNLCFSLTGEELQIKQ